MNYISLGMIFLSIALMVVFIIDMIRISRFRKGMEENPEDFTVFYSLPLMRVFVVTNLLFSGILFVLNLSGKISIQNNIILTGFLGLLILFCYLIFCSTVSVKNQTILYSTFFGKKVVEPIETIKKVSYWETRSHMGYLLLHGSKKVLAVSEERIGFSILKRRIQALGIQIEKR